MDEKNDGMVLQEATVFLGSYLSLGDEQLPNTHSSFCCEANEFNFDI